MKKFHYTIVLLILISSKCLGQIEGDVRNKEGNRISKATIIAIDSSRNFADSVTSNENGFYKFINLKPGTYLIEAKATGYLSKQYKYVEARVRVSDPEIGNDISNATRLQVILTPVKKQ